MSALSEPLPGASSDPVPGAGSDPLPEPGAERPPRAGSEPLLDPLLELRGIRAAHERITVLHGVDLSVATGQVVALLGPNGAGKTTTLRVAAGVHPVAAGQLRLAGRDMTGADPRDLARAGVCLIPEGRGVFPNLSVRDNLLMMTFTGRSREEIEEIAFARFPVLKQRSSQPAGTLSGGEQQMLALARGLATDPAVLLLDELSMGLAPLVVARLYEQVSEIARQGVAVLVVEQFAAAVLDIADHAAVLVRGRVQRQGHPDGGLRAELSALYLGSSA
ncbi:ABC transporter ATP-binding protein [Streptomyces sp. NBC_00203]|uniref:ABC transporter ATP-binding protein n=1 Tax=Streptomyces sp. NBC_00203 TaxID=2975680 RepID=UPI003251BCDD